MLPDQPEYPTIYIVGAGPGDPELLTCKAHRLLTTYAEIVVYDRLISNSLLDVIPEGVKRVYAGKSCRKHCMTQDEINAELVRQAKKGKRVIRLKGGDPFIFGRGGEEMLHLLAENIPVEIVPGVSAAAGISAALGIPLTHRGLATSVQYITGHQQRGETIEHDWRSLANPDCTLVVYMGLANLEEIMEKLMWHGLSPDVPAVIVQEGTMLKERKHFTTISMIAKDAEQLAYAPPSIAIVGEVVRLSPHYSP